LSSLAYNKAWLYHAVALLTERKDSGD